ncbi:leucyl aminopeptidase [Candidatus Peregrinibacteria bacterium]|jgi:leucyl aminopeptidase|nr:leucyl aminopeptidase [Candidatus Peregrinibacteria bacterium]
MKFEVTPKLAKTDCCIVSLFEKTPIEKQYKNSLPTELIKSIKAHIGAKDFEGKEESTLTIYPKTGSARKVILMGLGEKKKEMESDLPRRLGATARSLTEKCKTVSIIFPNRYLDLSPCEKFTEGFLLGEYKFEKYKSKKSDKSNTTTLSFIGYDKKKLKNMKEIQKVVESIFFVRDIVNTPGSDMSPNKLEKETRKIAKYANLKVKVINHKQLQKMKAGAILAVGQGATEKARMIVLEYKKSPKNSKPLALVGKGVCFDTGGLNLKPTRYIEDMKLDMGGAATVLGLFHAIGKTQPKLHVIGVIGVVENAISKEAYKPGDVIKALNGKTIEVLNTDAEGRLVLADCLTYVEKAFKPGHIIDFATLTGCAIYTVGHDMTPILGTDQKLIDNLLESGIRTDEFMWQLPLYERYAESLKGSISDLNNTGEGVKAGTVTASLFLREFINNGTPWVHCDIAGTAHRDKADSSYKPKGARGVLVRALWDFIKNY